MANRYELEILSGEDAATVASLFVDGSLNFGDTCVCVGPIKFTVALCDNHTKRLRVEMLTEISWYIINDVDEMKRWWLNVVATESKKSKEGIVTTKWVSGTIVEKIDWRGE